MRKILESCPSCGGPLIITTVRCERCATEVRSEYAPCPFCRLSAEQLSFVLLFMQNRGNLSEMEKALGVSYPTIRGKLDEILRVVAPVAPAAPAGPAETARPAAAPVVPPTAPATPTPPTAPAASAPPRPSAADRRRAILDAIAQGRLDAAGGLAALREAPDRPTVSGSAPRPEQQPEQHTENKPADTEEPR